MLFVPSVPASVMQKLRELRLEPSYCTVRAIVPISVMVPEVPVTVMV